MADETRSAGPTDTPGQTDTVRQTDTVSRAVHPFPVPQGPYLDGPILLRDGHPAYLRRATQDDVSAVQALLQRSSASARAFRFFAGINPEDPRFARQLIGEGANGDDLTLVVTVGPEDQPRLVAIAGYSCLPDGVSAEVGFLVEDAYAGKGLGTLLLERLAMGAEAAGLQALDAFVLTDNTKMLVVFTDSGFNVERRLDDGGWHIRLSLDVSGEGVERMEERDLQATRASLQPFFHPRAVAVVGASRDPKSIGYSVLHNLVLSGFQGPAFPVNPRADYVASIPAYASLRDIPHDIDLAVIAVPQPHVLDVIEDCAAKDVRAVVVLTAGFAETGPEGRQLQERLVRRVRGAGMRMIGPNCLGLIHTHGDVQMNATFATNPPLPGKVGMSSQSGALGLAILEYARSMGVGLSSFVSVGNKADVSGNDLIQWWETDELTDVILLYLESFGNPRRFARLARRIARKKPIVAVKGGRTSAGRRAAGSHTAALAASDVAVDALFRQTGVIRTRTLEEMFDVSALLTHQPLPRGSRVGIVTNAGGPGILCADACEGEGLQLPTLSAATQERLREFLPPAAGLGNPVDMIASATAADFHRTLRTLLEDDDIDAVIAIFIPTGAVPIADVTEAIRTARQAADAPEKPVAACLMHMGQTVLPLPGEEVIPSYRFPESAAIAMARAAQYAQWRRTPLGRIPDTEDLRVAEGRRVCREVLRSRGEGWLLPDEVDALLGHFGLPQAPGRLARSAEEAVAAAEALGFPVAVKLASSTLVHKTDWQGVYLNVPGPDEVRHAVRAIREELQRYGREAEMTGVWIQPMVRGGTEIFVGVTQDPTFGPLIAFGLGGITVELTGDVVFSITPLTDRDARDMVRSIKAYRLLEGYRNQPAADVAAAEDVLLRISRMVTEIPEIAEIDLNPIRLMEPGQGAVILDARVAVRVPDGNLSMVGVTGLGEASGKGSPSAEQGSHQVSGGQDGTAQ